MDNSVFEETDDGTVLYLPANKPMTHLQKKIDDALVEKGEDRTVLYLPGIKARTPWHKELRVFLEEEQKASEAGLSLKEERKQEETEEGGMEIVNPNSKGNPEECNKAIVTAEDENLIEGKVQALKIAERGEMYNIQLPVPPEPEREEDEESRKLRGKGNVEKWLQMLLEDTPEEGTDTNPQNVNGNKISRTDEIIRKLNLKYPQQQNSQQTVQKKDGGRSEEETVQIENRSTPIKTPPYKILTEKSKANEVGGAVGKGVERWNSFEGQERKEERSGKEKGLVRSESARAFRRIPSSPSLILGMRKGVDCIRKKPSVIGDDDDGDEDRAAGNTFIKSSIKTIKKAVKI